MSKKPRLRRKRLCPECQGKPTYFAKHDMFGCVPCDRWTESVCTCDEAECPFLKPPAKPSEVLP